MKIKHLHIRNYKQFSKLELDLTYPDGHEKAGKALDKICFIGQSGTGKTNLLEIIKKSVIDFSEQQNSYLPFSSFIGETTDDKYITNQFITCNNVKVDTLFTEDKSKITFSSKDEKKIFIDDEKNYFLGTNKYIVINEFEKEILETVKMSSQDKELLDRLTNTRASLVLDEINEPRENPYINLFGSSDSLLSAINGHDKKSVREKRNELNYAINELKAKYVPISNSLEKLKIKNFIDKNIVNINDESEKLWPLMKEKIDNYKIERTKYNERLTNRLLEDDAYDKKNYKRDIQEWEKKHENILEKIADDINIILNKFNLELTKIDENQKSYNGLSIKDLSNDAIIEYDDLSTGTKNLLSTFIPLKTYSPKDSIILIDEPEMSFYPDIQRELTDLYCNAGINNQLILATHSPLIASSFEPWEVVELKFDKNNQIYRELYYEGENHIDNYFLDPRLLTWTSILTDVFDLKENSNFSFREKKLMEYATLKAEIKASSNEKERKEKFTTLMKYSQLLGLSNNEKN